MTAFISRDLPADSVFRLMLEARGWRVHGRSLVELEALPLPQPLPAADWVFFSSANAVRFFFDQWSGPPPPYRWAAIGPATATALAAHVGKVDFAGAGDPETTAPAFAGVAEGQRVLFPGARHSRQSVPSLLGDRIAALALDLYDNRPLPDPPAFDDDVLAFPSPFHAEAYFHRHTLRPHQHVIAIGPTTAGALRRLGIAPVLIASEPTERGLAECALGIQA
jgi:uroporphyrinogen-III synthase